MHSIFATSYFNPLLRCPFELVDEISRRSRVSNIRCTRVGKLGGDIFAGAVFCELEAEVCRVCWIFLALTNGGWGAEGHVDAGVIGRNQCDGGVFGNQG